MEQQSLLVTQQSNADRYPFLYRPLTKRLTASVVASSFILLAGLITAVEHSIKEQGCNSVNLVTLYLLWGAFSANGFVAGACVTQYRHYVHNRNGPLMATNNAETDSRCDTILKFITATYLGLSLVPPIFLQGYSCELTGAALTNLSYAGIGWGALCYANSWYGGQLSTLLAFPTLQDDNPVSKPVRNSSMAMILAVLFVCSAVGIGLSYGYSEHESAPTPRLRV